MALAGNEVLYVQGLAPDGSLSPVTQATTTGAIASLAALDTSNTVVTTISTVGAGSLTAAALLGKEINRTGVQTGAFTDTTVSAATIIAALPGGGTVGNSWEVTYTNNQTAATGYVATIAGGSGVTVSGITTVPTGASAKFLITYTAANTITMVGRVASLTGPNALPIGGSTSGQTNLVATAIASGVLTLPAATDQLVGRATTDTLTNKTLTSPTLVTPALGTPTAGVLSSCTGLPLTTGVTGILAGANGGTGVANTGFTITLAGNLTTTGAFNTTLAQTASATYTLSGVAGTIAQSSGANLAVIDAYRCTAPQTANTNIVPANITGLSGAVAIGTYTFRASIYCTIASGTGGIAINQALTTAVLSACNFQAKGYTASAVAVQATTTAASGTVLFTQAAVVIQIDIEGSFTVSTAGTFALQMCQSASNGSNSVVNVGSTMTLTRIA